MPEAANRLQERLAQKLAEKSGSDKPVHRDQCKSSSYPTKASRYGPDGMYRCTKEQWHADKRHVDDQGTVWVTEPSFKRLVDRRPR